MAPIHRHTLIYHKNGQRLWSPVLLVSAEERLFKGNFSNTTVTKNTAIAAGYSTIQGPIAAFDNQKMKDLLWTGTGETEVAAIPISLGGNSVFGPCARTGLLLTDSSTPWLQHTATSSRICWCLPGGLYWELNLVYSGFKLFLFSSEIISSITLTLQLYEMT